MKWTISYLISRLTLLSTTTTAAHRNPIRYRDHFYYDALGNRTGWNEVASRGAMLFKGKTNGLNQYLSWENSYSQPPQHWGSPTNYDDDVGQGWGAPGAANGVLMQEGYITAGYNALNQPIQISCPFYEGTQNWMWFGFDPLGRCVKRGLRKVSVLESRQIFSTRCWKLSQNHLMPRNARVEFPKQSISLMES